MSPDEWAKVEEAFFAAAEMPLAERNTFLDTHLAGNTYLIGEVLKLLDSDNDAEDFIESPIWTDSSFLNTSAKRELSRSIHSAASVGDDMTGRQIGAFRTVRQIGRGGMGAVYLAERVDGEFQQTVAIKLIKRGMDTAFIVRRFRHERQILASFEHPFIARLLDGGSTDDGIPYFVMEYIEGDTIIDYCDKNTLDIGERLRIFRKICSALEYAHDRQIVHRDIKPGNILINHSGTPKLLDFGIAKIMDPDLIHESVNPTGSLLRMMTPDYASPEQVAGTEVTAVSDIYSLGVLLYELLSGHRPYDFAGRALHEVSRVVCEEMPDPLSEAVLKTTGILPKYLGSVDKIFETRRTSDVNAVEMLRKGLDDIVMKAMAKAPAERYQDMREFSEDVSRFLAGTRVAAPKYLGQKRADSRKQGQRPKNSVAVLPFKFIDLGGGRSGENDEHFLGLGLADALIARLSKVRRLLVRPTSSIKTLTNDSVDPISAGRELGVDHIIDGTIKKANDRFRVGIQLLDVKENSAVWATSVDENVADMLSLEDSLANRLIEALLPQLTGSELAEFAKRGTSVPEAFEQYLRGRYYFNAFTEEGFAKAFVCFHSAIAADPEYALAYCGIADYYNWLGIVGVLPPQECFLPAIDAARKAVEIDPELSEAHATLGFSLHAGEYDWPAAENHLKKAIELNFGNAVAYVWYSIVLCTEGRFDQAVENAKLAVELDPLTPFNQHNVGWILYYAERYPEAERAYEKMLQNFPSYGFGYYGLSKIQRKVGKTAQSLDNIKKASEAMQQSIFARLAEAESLAAADRHEDARTLLKELLELKEERYVSFYQVALVYMYLGDQESALRSLKKAYATKEAWLNWLSVDPVFAPIRSDHRVIEMIKDVGYFELSERPPERDPSATEVITSENEGLPAAAFGDKTTLLIDPTHVTAGVSGGRKRNMTQYIIAASLLAGAILIGVFIYTGVISFKISEQRGAAVVFQNPSLVILPFTGGPTTNELIGPGLADALSQRLGYVKGLRVISPNTGRTLARNGIENAGRDLGVMYVLRGELDSNGTETIFNGELIDTASMSPIWSGKVTNDHGDYFALQTKLAEKVLETLKIDPLPAEKRVLEKVYTDNFSAYEKYLIARIQMAKRDSESLYRATALFSSALSDDALFAPAYVGLADANSLLNLYDITPPPNSYEKALEYAKKALQIDDDLAEAHASLGYIDFFYKRDRAAAELEFRRATQMNPSYAQAHHWFALALSGMGRPVDAISEIQTAQNLDPGSLAIRSAAGIVYFLGNDLESALDQCESALALDPTFVPALKVKRWILFVKGDTSAARETLEKEMLNSGGDLSIPGWRIVNVQVSDPGAKDAAENMLKEAIETKEIQENDFSYAFEIALAFLHLGNSERALYWLERAESAGSHSMNMIQTDPRVGPLRNEPRFQRLLHKIETPKS